MATNYYLVTDSEKTFHLEIISTGELARGTTGCGKPYAVVSYNNSNKQLVFSCDTDLSRSTHLKVVLNEGLLGFVVVKKVMPLPSSSYKLGKAS